MSSSPPSPPPTCLPRRLPPPETPPPLRFPSERHRLHHITVRPFHPPQLSPVEAALTFPLPHRHYRVVPPSPPTTGALSPPMNVAARSILHRLSATPLLGSAPPPTALAGALPVAPASSPAAPCRQLGATEPPASMPPPSHTRELCAVSAPGARVLFPRRGPRLRRTGAPGRGPASLSATRE
jgi:hypothetical protein